MTITLSPDQLAWIEVRVAQGEFPDVGGAVRSLLADAIAGRGETEDDDLAWAKPLVDEALAAIGRCETMTLDEFEAHLDTTFGVLAD